MIASGIIMMIIGFVMYQAGVYRSRDVDAIMNDFFNDGVVNNGSDTKNTGMVLIVIGVILLIVGLVLRYNNNKPKAPSAPSAPSNNTIYHDNSNYFYCSYCGCKNSSQNKFCQNCGSRKETDVICSSCGSKIAKGNNFCGNCGAKSSSDSHEINDYSD